MGVRSIDQGGGLAQSDLILFNVSLSEGDGHNRLSKYCCKTFSQKNFVRNVNSAIEHNVDK